MRVLHQRRCFGDDNTQCCYGEGVYTLNIPHFRYQNRTSCTRMHDKKAVSTCLLYHVRIRGLVLFTPEGSPQIMMAKEVLEN